ncbi:DUF1003 domain-containing protein [Paraburkholderia caribensis]|uniref:DUF1003 domain-containing protein n=1 Tax=Paraburkholderia caribensis TaxID=75105 RepID=UPI001F412D60|nr:DUF1003 domain-containing protein [Paraburkholderia caribensis]
MVKARVSSKVIVLAEADNGTLRDDKRQEPILGCRLAICSKLSSISATIMKDKDFDSSSEESSKIGADRHYRFHAPYVHLHSAFGDDWFALKAERFARFFGTPTFLIAQTIIVVGWMAVNVFGWTKFDVYPFILLNLAFSLQAAYAAPLILLAQTRQADRDKAHSDADARHREDLAKASEERQLLAANQSELLLGLLQQNTQLTEMTKQMSERIEALTLELHSKLAKPAPGTQA